MSEAAIRWIAENPIVPSTKEALTLLQERVESGHLSNEDYDAIPITTIKCVIAEWQRRMFLKPERDVPKGEVQIIADLVGKAQEEALSNGQFDDHEDRRKWGKKILTELEAYRRGKASK